MTLVYKRRALRHIVDIHNYIAKNDSVAAKSVVSRIERAISRLATIPLSARPGSIGGTRILVVPGLPYIVIHRVRADCVDIIAVLHTAQRRRS